MNKTTGSNKLSNLLVYLLAAMLILVPFHALLTVWLASNFGHYTLFRLWIEAGIGVLCIGVVCLVLQQKVLLAHTRARWLWWLSVGYVSLHVVLGIVALHRHEVNQTALADGLVLNVRPIAIFWLAVIITNRNDWLQKHWKQLLLWPAAFVIAFGLLQHFILPIDFLHHLGYGPQTILPYETVDQKLAYVRVMSTLRGANPLGAYLVVVIAALTALIAYAKKQKSRLILGAYLLAALVVLFFSYSRSAWIGAMLSVACLVWLAISQQKARRTIVGAGVVFAIVAGLGAVALRHNSRFDNTFLHTDKTSQSTSSNQNHVSALKSGLRDIAQHPFGHGPGTAGPASIHNNQAARIAENYFIQIGQEVGVLGVVIFILINILVGKALWRRRGPLSSALLASLLGICLINLLSHAWTDDTLAVVWWALAGVALASDIISTISKKHEKTTKKAALPTHPIN